MKRIVTTLCLSLLFMQGASAQLISANSAGRPMGNAVALTNAVQAAQRWLKLADDNEFSETWTSASPLIQQASNKEEWTASMQEIRAKLGYHNQRRGDFAKFKTALPGVPDGEYVVIQYRSWFENKRVTETIVPAKMADGSWKVAAYYVR